MRTAGGEDSIISSARNIKEARKFGFVEKAVLAPGEVVISLNVFTPGEYIIRVFDADTKIYSTSDKRILKKGINDMVVKGTFSGNNLRADLFSGNTMVHGRDITPE